MTFLKKVIHKVSGYGQIPYHQTIISTRCKIQTPDKTSTKWGRVNCSDCLKTKMKKF